MDCNCHYSEAYYAKPKFLVRAALVISLILSHFAGIKCFLGETALGNRHDSYISEDTYQKMLIVGGIIIT